VLRRQKKTKEKQHNRKPQTTQRAVGTANLWLSLLYMYTACNTVLTLLPSPSDKSHTLMLFLGGEENLVKMNDATTTTNTLLYCSGSDTPRDADRLVVFARWRQYVPALWYTIHGYFGALGSATNHHTAFRSIGSAILAELTALTYRETHRRRYV